MITTRSAPAQLDEQPVRVGVRLLRAVELFHALGGLLVAQAHAVGRAIRTPSLSSSPPWGRGHVHPCCRLCFDKQATAPGAASPS